MTALEATDPFRNCEDEDDSINTAAELIDNSVRQYSQNQSDRVNKALQLVNQSSEKQDTSTDKKNIDPTISEDCGDGHLSKHEASLRLLGLDDLKLFLPTDHLEDEELHIIETTFQESESGRHSLQDYQRQLMLLEQQNERRFWKARFEEEEKASKRAKRLARDAQIRSKLPGSEEDKGVQRRSALNMARKRTNDGAVDNIKEKKLLRSLDQPISKTTEGISRPENLSKPTNVQDVENISPHLTVLYKVSCKRNNAVHPLQYSYDLPIPVSVEEPDYSYSGRLHLEGKNPVYNIESFMENENDDTAAVIIRTIECSEASILTFQAEGSLRWTEALYLKSRVLKSAIQQIITCYFQPVPKKRQPWEIATTEGSGIEQNRIYPADLVAFHHRHLLRSWSNRHTESKPHIDAILDYTDKIYGIDFAEAEVLFDQGVVSHKHILKLFKPNELLISGTYGKPAAFILQEWPLVTSNGWITLTCWSFQTNGTGYERKLSTLMIPPLGDETKKIQSLVAYPLRFASSDLRSLILQRGVKQWEHRIAKQVTYKGWNVDKDQYFPDGRFMIDHKMYHKMHPHARVFRFDKPETTHPYDNLPAALAIEQEPSELALLLMPVDIHGFYLNEKKWIKLFAELVQPVTWNKKAFERLVLPEQTKNLVRALVTVRTSQRGVKQGLGVAGKRTDITSGKGNGLIMLLHGGPGTGKTLTAESVAEIAEMPLYRVTCGDIGTNAEAVEKYLNTVLHLGKIWECVLLLDEADIFLEERSMSDLERNSLVSVFLRILEYYDGILILTSNRVGMFDEAFKSRIQVALHYENLNRSARKRIWQNFFDMLEEDDENVNFDELKFHLDELAEKPFNGRQIRNVLTTARQLAIYENERLDWKHMNQALVVSSDFSDYLKRMQGHTDDQRARDIGLR